MVPVGLSEAIIQRVSALRASDGGSQILVMACMCLSGLLDVMAIMIAAVLCYWVGWHRADVGLCRDHWAWQPTCIDRSVIVRGTGGAPHFLAIAPQRKKISMKQDKPQVKAV